MRLRTYLPTITWRVVLTNEMPAEAAPEISHKIASLLFSEAQALDEQKQQALRIFEQLQQGTIDRQLFTANGSSYFTGEALKDFATSLAPLGPPQEFVPTGKEERGGMTFFGYKAKFSQTTFAVWVHGKSSNTSLWWNFEVGLDWAKLGMLSGLKTAGSVMLPKWRNSPKIRR